jgi:Ras-related protein Rab-5C
MRSLLKIQPLRFKVVMLGDTSVGKTSIINQGMKDDFQDTQLATIGSTYSEKTVVTSKGDFVTLELWDTGGQERFRCLVPLYYRDATAALVVFGVDHRASFERSKSWVNELKQERQGCFVMLVGNKIDSPKGRAVSVEEAREYALTEGLQYLEASALSGAGIQSLFTELAEILVRSANFTGSKSV